MSMWKENGYKSVYVWKREQKVQNNGSNKKITDTTEYCVRLEPVMFAMRSERHTTTPTARMRAKVLNRVM